MMDCDGCRRGVAESSYRKASHSYFCFICCCVGLCLQFVLHLSQIQYCTITDYTADNDELHRTDIVSNKH